MTTELIKELKAYRVLRGYTVIAGHKAIRDIEDCMKDPQNEVIKEHLEGRLVELKTALETIEGKEEN